jgi:predicted dehydrogenase
MVEIYCYYSMRARQNPPDTAPPANLDYEMWTGPAPMRPYNKLVHPRGWRNFMEYGNGIIGDMGVHMLDLTRWMLGLGWPISISSSGGILVDKEARPYISDTQTAVFDYGSLQVVWQHRSWGDPPDPQYFWGATFYGDKGTLKASVNCYDFIPKGRGQCIHRDAVNGIGSISRGPDGAGDRDLRRAGNRGNMRDFMSCVASRGRPISDIEEGYISSASCILANVS